MEIQPGSLGCGGSADARLTVLSVSGSSLLGLAGKTSCKLFGFDIFLPSFWTFGTHHKPGFMGDVTAAKTTKLVAVTKWVGEVIVLRNLAANQVLWALVEALQISPATDTKSWGFLVDNNRSSHLQRGHP